MGRNAVIILLLLFPLWLASPLNVYPQTEFFLSSEPNRALSSDLSELTQGPVLAASIDPQPATPELLPSDDPVAWHPMPYLPGIEGTSGRMVFPLPLPPACDACPQEWLDGQPREAPTPEDSRKKTQKNIGEIFGLTPWTTYLYFLRPLEPRPLKRIRQKKADRIILNAVYLKPNVDEKRKIRDIWTKVLGMDVWYPYFKAKEIEDWMKERISFGFKKMKCKPKFIKNSFSYVCKKTF